MQWRAVIGSSKTKHVNTGRTAIDFSRRFTAASVYIYIFFFLLVLQLLLNIKEHTQTHTFFFYDTVSLICIFVCCCSVGIRGEVGVTGDA